MPVKSELKIVENTKYREKVIVNSQKKGRKIKGGLGFCNMG